MPNRKTVENWGFNNLGVMNVTSVMNMVKLIWYIRKHVLKYSSSNNEVASSPNLIKAQVEKSITGTDVIKKSNFSDNVKKMVFQLDAVNGLNQLLETPSGQTSIVNCVRGMNQISKD